MVTNETLLPAKLDRATIKLMAGMIASTEARYMTHIWSTL
jgi:hypothetical protein